MLVGLNILMVMLYSNEIAFFNGTRLTFTSIIEVLKHHFGIESL